MGMMMRDNEETDRYRIIAINTTDQHRWVQHYSMSVPYYSATYRLDYDTVQCSAVQFSRCCWQW
jgi:hypothetical protein